MIKRFFLCNCVYKWTSSRSILELNSRLSHYFTAQTSGAHRAGALHVIQFDHITYLFPAHIRSWTFQNHFVCIFRRPCVWAWQAACEVKTAEPRPYDFIWDDCWLWRTPARTSFHCLLVSQRKRGGEEREEGVKGVRVWALVELL